MPQDTEGYIPGCGACNLCCRLLAVPDIHKPAQMLCEHTTVHGGCARQAEKTTAPELQACHQFQCVWLASQSSEGRLPRNLRPDMCHVVLGPKDREKEKYLYIQIDPEFPAAWRAPDVREYLDGATARGWEIEIILGPQHFSFSKDL